MERISSNSVSRLEAHTDLVTMEPPWGRVMLFICTSSHKISHQHKPAFMKAPHPTFIVYCHCKIASNQYCEKIFSIENKLSFKIIFYLRLLIYSLDNVFDIIICWLTKIYLYILISFVLKINHFKKIIGIFLCIHSFGIFLSTLFLVYLKLITL